MGLGSDARGILGDYNLIITHKYTPKGFIWGFHIGLYVGRDTSNYISPENVVGGCFNCTVNGFEKARKW